jgi:hypothetical protein
MIVALLAARFLFLAALLLAAGVLAWAAVADAD